MASETVTVRFVPLYINQKKLATLENVTFDIDSGDEDLIATEGWVGATDGAITCKATADCISPVDSSQEGVSFVDAMLNKKYVNCSVPWMGKIYSWTARFKGAAMKSEPKSGKTSGSFSLTGGQLRAVA